jgi:hypothetical protein
MITTMMTSSRCCLITLLLVLFTAPLFAQASTAAPSSGTLRSGIHDFDFEFGEWRVHHRVKRTDGSGWLAFEGTCRDRGLNDGSVNVEENTFQRPSGLSYGTALRAYDPKSAQWAIWWVDGRDPHGAMDPPVKGRFENGVGAFYSDSVIDGKPIRTRYLWSHITATSARWEQAYSGDGGKTWETNWIMDFQRTAPVE